MRVIVSIVLLCLTASIVSADDKRFSLTAPDFLRNSGFLQHILPRFSMKTGIKIDDGDGLVFQTRPAGQVVFSSQGTHYFLDGVDTKAEQRFRDWLISDIGRRTIESFENDAGVTFQAVAEQAETVQAADFTGDAIKGETLSLALCGRCHVVNDTNRMNDIGSTPSFAVLRTFSDWDVRFQIFYTLKPHGAFTQVDGVTDPFDPLRPSPIAPIAMTIQDLDAIIAFVATVQPADLGAPIQHQ
ncbi:hypothetical protein HRQ87_12205 [Sulfitobacter sp. 1151]|uniref:Cytochrome c domain-containing protein n=1 Tax=Parasulfitobacter algicola TaxID=2614809 RepID=A0ABX2IYB8_9RHOB|nr:hypothetical protein [Sulfitobacter algicola]